MSETIDVNILITRRDAYQRELNQCSQWSEFSYRQHVQGRDYSEAPRQAWLRQMIGRLDMQIRDIEKAK